MDIKKVDDYRRDEIISFSKLRAFIGITGIALPVLAVLGCLCFGEGKASFQISISHYYYSKMHIVFTGVLCVLGGFLITYQGKNKWESKLSNFAGLCSFGIAACPTEFGGFIVMPDRQNIYLLICDAVTPGWGTVHFIFAGLLFVCFIIFCLYFFQTPDDPRDMNDAKFKRRKMIYKTCGWAIIVSILMMAVFFKWPHLKKGIFIYSTFIFETTSLWAFGIAWLVKGSRSLEHLPVVKKLVEAVR